MQYDSMRTLLSGESSPNNFIEFGQIDRGDPPNLFLAEGRRNCIRLCLIVGAPYYREVTLAELSRRAQCARNIPREGLNLPRLGGHLG